MRGFVYVMANDHMPSLVKIGYSDRDPEIRANELSSTTGVPGKYEVMYYAYMDKPRDTERLVHNSLVGFRTDKEFFRISLFEAVKTIRSTNPVIIFESLAPVVAQQFPELATMPVSELEAEIESLKKELSIMRNKLELCQESLTSKLNKSKHRRRTRKRKRGY